MYVYVLRCADGALYIGHAEDLSSRLQRHNDGRGSIFTASRRPVSPAYVEAFESETSAIARERQLKRWTRKKKEALLAGDVKALKTL